MFSFPFVPIRNGNRQPCHALERLSNALRRVSDPKIDATHLYAISPN